MASESQERDPFEAALEAKVARWTAALESYRAAKALDGGIGAVDVSLSGVSLQGRSIDLPVGVFRDKGVKEAIQIYLEAVRRKQTNKEIAGGLIRGGIATTSDNFEATVGTALLRLKNEGVLLRFSDGWDLAASYPDSLRNRLEKETKPTRKRTRARAKAAANGRKKPKTGPRAAPPPKSAASSKLEPGSPSPGFEARITAYLQGRGAEFSTAEEIASAIKASNLQVVRLVLGKMLKRELIERNTDGRVRLVNQVA